MARASDYDVVETMSRRVISIRYVHEHNGKRYEHEFGKGVDMCALADGSVLLYKRGVRLFDEFPDED